MAEEYTVRVHLISGEERIAPAKNIHHVGEEGARRGVAIVDGIIVPIYNRVEWGYLWYEQEPLRDPDDPPAQISHMELAPDQWITLFEDGIVLISSDGLELPSIQEIKLDASAATRLYEFLLLHINRLTRHARIDRGE
jgi:hypothetical protein